MEIEISNSFVKLEYNNMIIYINGDNYHDGINIQEHIWFNGTRYNYLKWVANYSIMNKDIHMDFMELLALK